jgi:hypothetical protein
MPIDPTKSGTAAFPPLVVAQNQAGVMGMGVIDASGLDCVQPGGVVTETGTPHVDLVPLPVTRCASPFGISTRRPRIRARWRAVLPASRCSWLDVRATEPAAVRPSPLTCRRRWRVRPRASIRRPAHGV